MSDMKYAEIVVDLPVKGPFTYLIPPNLTENVSVGKRVRVPFRNRMVVGYIVGFRSKTNLSKLSVIQDVIDEEPIIDSDILSLTKWMADYYFCSWGKAIEAAIPLCLKKGKTKVRETNPNYVKDKERQINHNIDSSSGFVENTHLKAISNSIARSEFSIFLIHGETENARFNLYIQTIDYTLGLGKSIICLMPEILLTSGIVKKIKFKFGEEVAVIHSRLLRSESYSDWKKIREGKTRVVVGTRSAIFAPVKNLGLVIVDEEQDLSYKQEEAPRYNGRDAAVQRAKISNATVVLGSSVPSVESYFKAEKGEFKLIKLDKKMLPHIKIVDMQEESAEKRRRIVFSTLLENKIRETLRAGEQVVLFLNRRGFASSATCKKCGFVLKCKHCNVVLTYHFMNRSLICHICNYKMELPDICPECNSSYVGYFGVGTQKVESEAHRLFPDARISRIDKDAVTKEKILTDFRDHRTDILIGTQMIVRHPDFPKAKLIGVISTDILLSLPDFRAGERTFEILTRLNSLCVQKDEYGEVIIQTNVPNFYIIKANIEHDYLQFYNKEISSRIELGLPPFTHIVRIIVQSPQEELGINEAKSLTESLKRINKIKTISIIGPLPAAIFRIRGRFRWDIMLKGKKVESICKLMRESFKDFKKKRNVVFTVDVDPLKLT